MSDLTTTRSILQGETLHPPSGGAHIPELIADYTWYSLEELAETYARRTRTISDDSARIAYNRAVRTAQNVLRAQGGTHYSDEGHEVPTEHLTLKPGDYVVWGDCSGQITELDSFGWAFVKMRTKQLNGRRGHHVSIRVKRELLQRI